MRGYVLGLATEHLAEWLDISERANNIDIVCRETLVLDLLDIQVEKSSMSRPSCLMPAPVALQSAARSPAGLSNFEATVNAISMICDSRRISASAVKTASLAGDPVDVPAGVECSGGSDGMLMQMDRIYDSE